MVGRDGERWISVGKKRRDELELRIGQTNTGYDWLRRVKKIGKNGSNVQKGERQRSRDRERRGDSMKTRDLQRQLNKFVKERLKYVAPLRVDGKRGPATNHRIQVVKYYLGFQRSSRTKANAHKVDAEFMRRLRNPNEEREYSTEAAFKRAVRRRRWQRAHASKPKPKVMKRYGIGTFDGKPCANAAIRYLLWARNTGHNGVKWRGQLNSGWRSKAYSQHLCYAMCGAPQCPGRCAGAATNHVYSQPDHFAIDVSDYVTFGSLMRHCPIHPNIYNALGSRDPVHFSPSGR